MDDLETVSIERIKTASEMSLAYYKKPLVICISGGKDSSVITELAIRSGCPVEFMHNHTTADAPETVRFVRSEFERLENLGYKCTLNLPTYKGSRTSMWNLIPRQGIPPMRIARYCCKVLKETGGKDRFITTGVRWAESTARKNSRGTFEKLSSDRKKSIILTGDNEPERALFENCRLKGKRVCNPIIDWKDNDVIDFTKDCGCPMNPLYEEGFCRVGCIGCPMAGKFRAIQFDRWPKYKQMYINAFDRMIEVRKAKGLPCEWRTGTDVFHWWMEDGVLPGQVTMEDILEDDDDE